MGTGAEREIPLAGVAARARTPATGAPSGPMLLVSVYMLVLGAGLGLVMQVIILAVQNDSPPGEMGISTTGVSFFRSMGGAIGVALFG